MYEDLGFNVFSTWPSYAVVIPLILIGLIFAYKRAPLWLWTIFVAIMMWGYGGTQGWWITFAIIAVIFNVYPIRRYLISAPIMKLLDIMGFLPTISETEKIALEAGKNWFEGEYFDGRPRFNNILKEKWPELSEEEQQFMDKQAEEICEMIDDWEVHKEQDLPPQVWEYLKKENFFGLVIPKEYGGKEFSAYALNRLIQKLGSRSIPLAVDVMVPNSLGPAELLSHYGTQTQKNYYLPRLADGREIPAFGLTEPNAGSDASAVSSRGEVFKGHDGQLYIKLNWNKRYITLASVATLLGLAFQLDDPNEYLGKGKHPGITCGLIPTSQDGVDTSYRHHPLSVPFINSPTTGTDVVVSIDQIIGGPEQAGNGWKMLMETLAAGRGIYLPALSTGGAKFASRMGGSYALIREQFGLPIGRFEGIQEILGRIGGKTYLMDSFNRFTAGAVDSGKKPAVISAIVKYMASEINRQVIIDNMDLVGGKGIVMGPNNPMAHAYMAAPIGITVEGSNVVTRSLIIFGQGLISCHPHAFNLMDSLQNGNLKNFDKSLWNHFGMMFSNVFRNILLSLTRGRIGSSPVGGTTAKYYKKLQWASARFSITADMALLSMGAALKKKEKISGRFADILSWLYICTSVLRRFEAEGRKKEDLPFVHWAMRYGLYQINQNFQGIYKNFKAPLLGPLVRGPLALWCRINALSKYPGDRLSRQISSLMQTPGGVRDRLTTGLYLPVSDKETVAIQEKAFELSYQSLPVREKLKNAEKKGKLPKEPVRNILDSALNQGIINKEEAELLEKAESYRDEVVKVDSFPAEGFKHHVPPMPKYDSELEQNTDDSDGEGNSSPEQKKEVSQEKDDSSKESILDKIKKFTRL